jgi:hypothetical protein
MKKYFYFIVILFVIIVGGQHIRNNNEIKKEQFISEKNIFIVSSYHKGDLCGQPQLDAVIEALRQNNMKHFNIHEYYLDTRKRLYEDVIQDVEKIKNEIDMYKPMFVVVIDDPAFNYLYKYVLEKDNIYLVFTGINRSIQKYNEDYQFLDNQGNVIKKITGVYEYLFIREQFELLEFVLKKDINKIALLHSTDQVGMIIMDQILEEIKDTKYDGKIKLYSASTKSEVIQHLYNIKYDDAITAWIPATLSIIDDKHEHRNMMLTMNSLAPLMVEVIQKPDLSLNMSFTELGFYGGISIDFYHSGFEAGQLVASIYNGIPFSKLPIMNATKNIVAINITRLRNLNIEVTEELLSKIDILIM